MNLTGVTLGATKHVSIFKGRHKYIYGVNGVTRGFRWDGAASTVQPIGLNAPTSAVTASTSAATDQFVAAINVVDGGAGYYAPPQVAIIGGGVTTGSSNQAQAIAQLRNGSVVAVLMTKVGSGYTSVPNVTFTGGVGTGAAATYAHEGKIESVLLTSQGGGYTDGATVSFSGGGITGAIGKVDVFNGKVTGIRIINPGSGATTNCTASISDSTGGGAACVPIMVYAITAVTVSGGTGYAGTVPIVFSSVSGYGAAAYCTANSSGALTNAVITSRGAYFTLPTVEPKSGAASATAMLRAPLKGAYRFCIRYIDDTPPDEGGPIPSNITDLTTVNAGEGGSGATWTWSNSGADARASAVELWRTSANQSLVLYRVAVLPRVAGVLPTTYTDTISEAELLNPTRTDYAFMPITLPSGQLNARRFTPPPTDMEDACWFQDRAWYGANTDGTRPNSLLFSEIDEPESVPDVNELIVQENTGQQDRVVGLFPFGSMLVIAQQRHLYRLVYVSQPVIDASITLVGTRGALNKRCWSSFEGVLYIADSFGVYAFDGNNMEPISAAVDNYWRDSIIDFSKSANFFLKVDPQQRVVRFHYCTSGDGAIPKRTLCYSLATKTWWEEEYAQSIGASEVVSIAGKQVLVGGAQSGALVKMNSGVTDLTTAGSTTGVTYQYRTPPLPMVKEPDARVGVLFAPAATTSAVTLRLHYNGSSTHRPNAVYSDRGEGVLDTPDGSIIDMRSDRSSLSPSTGYSTVRCYGWANDRSSGGDRYVAVALTGSATVSAVTFHGVTVGGVTA